MIELEYKYVTNSSFETERLRNQYIQFYFVLVGAVISAGAALAQGDLVIHPYAVGAIAAFVGIVGFLEGLVFVRLRRVVLECPSATVLMKIYVR